MSVPSIKGVAFKGLIEDLESLRSNGGVDDAELAAALTEADRAWLDDQIAPGFWYPMESYDRILALLVEKEGAPDPVAYLHGRGERAMKRMLDLGLYPQFDSMEEGWGGRVGRVMTSLGGAVYNFARWEFLRPDDEDEAARRFAIELSEAEALSEHALRTIEGAVAMLAARAAGGPVDVAVRRPESSQIRIEVERR